MYTRIIWRMQRHKHDCRALALYSSEYSEWLVRIFAAVTVVQEHVDGALHFPQNSVVPLPHGNYSCTREDERLVIPNNTSSCAVLMFSFVFLFFILVVRTQYVTPPHILRATCVPFFSHRDGWTLRPNNLRIVHIFIGWHV